YIYSLLLAKEYLNSDLLLLHGDLVFDDAVLANTLASPQPNTVLVNRQTALPEKDFKARLVNGEVKEISIKIFGDDCAFLIPLYKLSSTLIQAWLIEMEQFAARNELNVYAENALNNLLADYALSPVYFQQELCTEIDNLQDLAKVKAALAARGEQ
ncbi:MAG TPA: phosphocholine cytidylyltransferase family protein, partial [Oscillospiraceae bacterium]|nr:phosphocholine cytidylyltransferase family protein [Oscillospiraceae bacterium]